MKNQMTRTRKSVMDGENVGETSAAVHPIAEKAPRSRAGSDAHLQPPATDTMEMEVGDSDVPGNTAPENPAGTEIRMADSPGANSQISNVTSTGKSKKVPKKRTKWSEAKEEKLIELYQERPFLYTLTENNYHNRMKKRAAITFIASQLSMEGKNSVRLFAKKSMYTYVNIFPA